MNVNHHIFAAILALLPLTIGSTSSQSTSAEPTLWGIYGAHDKHDCPVNNYDTAVEVNALSKKDLQPIMDKYGVITILDQYHSGLEHTFLWAVETSEPHRLEEFCIELGVARWNNLKFVPLRTFEKGVIPDVRAIHALEEWEPSIASNLHKSHHIPAESASVQPTLWGIYGAHDKHDCPVNNRETAKEVIALSQMNPQPLMEKYGVTSILDRYHSGLEHTFLWAVETTEPHKLEEFSIELGVARWNDLKFVPLRTFTNGVLPDVLALHGLQN